MSEALWILRVIYYYNLHSAKQSLKANMTEPLWSNNRIFVAECWQIKKEQIRRTKTEEMRFIRAAVGHRMMDRKCNEDIKEELGIKETRKGNNEKYHMEELDLLK